MLIVDRANGSLDNELFVIDVPAITAKGGAVKGAVTAETPAAVEPVLLTPHRGVATCDPLDWALDGRSLWLISDADREFQALGLVRGRCCRSSIWRCGAATTSRS